MNAVQGGAVTFAATILICYLVGLSCPEPEPVTFTVLTPIQAPPTLTPIPLPQTTQKMETPKVTYTGTNRTPMPNGWTTAYTGNEWGIGGVANVVLDTSVQHNGANSLRIDPTGATGNTAREANSYYLNVQPGNHIYFAVWIKTSAAAVGETDRCARFGLDFYGSGGRIQGIQTPDGTPWTLAGGWPANEDNQFVDWGSDWTLKVMEFTVAATYDADYWCGEGYSLGDHAVPTGCIPWYQVASSVDGGEGWFSDPVFYVNPSEEGGVSVPVLVSCLLMQRR